MMKRFLTPIVGMLACGAAILCLPVNVSPHEHAAQSGAGSGSGTPPEIEIIIRAGGHPMLKGPQTDGPMIALVAGQVAVLAFRNEDSVPRQLVSPLFTRVDVHFAGRATGIFRKDAVGFRLDPGANLILEFTVPEAGFPQMYDLIWCSHDHDKEQHQQLDQFVIVRIQEQ